MMPGVAARYCLASSSLACKTSKISQNDSEISTATGKPAELSFQQYNQKQTIGVSLYNTRWRWGVIPGVAARHCLASSSLAWEAGKIFQNDFEISMATRKPADLPFWQ